MYFSRRSEEAELERQVASELIATVRERRVRLGLSQQALAGLAGCSLATVRTIEAGPPSLAMAERIVAALGRIESEVEGS